MTARTTRAATFDDLPAITALHRAWDTHWLGAPENDESEIREDLERVPAGQSVLVHDGLSLVGVGWWWGIDTTLLAHPDADQAAVHAVLLDWFHERRAPQIQALSRDDALRSALTARAWPHDHSSFELVRPVEAEWRLEEPEWPAGVEIRALAPDDLPAVHHLVYRDAEWGAVPGHVERGFDEWRSLFVTASDPAEQQVLAWRGDRLVGAALGRFFSDGTGWVSQLAVARPERGHGLGRALLLEALHRRRAGGAKALGLAVQAENQAALRLYLGVGLQIDREWQTHRRPRG